MRRLNKSMVPLIFFQFGVTSMLVISCGGQTNNIVEHVDFNKIFVTSAPIKDEGLVVTLTKVNGDVRVYGLYGFDTTVGPNKHDIMFNGIKTYFPMRLCIPKPREMSFGIEGLTPPFSRFGFSYSPGTTGAIPAVPCPTTTTTTTTSTTTSTTTTKTTIPTITPNTTTKLTTTTSTNNNTTLAANNTLPTNTIFTTTDRFGMEVGKNDTDVDEGDKCHSEIRVVAGLVFVSIICNNLCNHL